ncbi:asparagine synthetase B family protein [Ferrovibrio sp.]|uniref:asparagine synthetase B family protein n=1 Tax=Ferrovibrio sp. TaxID=1917215 RepID=UPI003D0C4D2B
MSGADRLGNIATTYGGGGKPTVWRGTGAAFAHVPRPFTPEDRLDRLPGSFAGDTSRLVFDGRLDNRDDLIAALEIEPARAAGLGDAALLMAALERWGTDACLRLVGAFSFAWWDATSHRLILAVDATGGRAVFAHDDTRRLCFATRPLAVLGFPGVKRQIDEIAMAHLLLARPMPADHTAFHGVFRLPPAGLLVWQQGRYSVSRYWQPDLGRHIRYRDNRDYVLAGRDMLDRVVKASLRAIGPVGSQLSGGLDSAAVSATAARLLAPGRLHTLTAFPDPSAPLPSGHPRLIYNEASLAGATAALYPNIDAHYLPAGDITPGEEDASRLFQECGLPLRNFTNFGSWQPLYAKARELGASVILTGISGNHTLSWKSEALLADLASSGRFIALAQQLWGLHQHDQRLWPQIRSNLLSYLGPAGIRKAVRRWRGTDRNWQLRSSASEALAATVDAGWITERVRAATDRPDRDRRQRLAYLERNWAQNQWLTGISYVTGCDLRDPLGDRRMTEFCLALPAELWQSGGQPRSFAREVLRDRLPAVVLDSRARGYQDANWFHRLTVLRPVFMAELDRLENSPAARHMLNLSRIRAVAEDWPADADAAMARGSDMLDLFGRGIHYGRFIRWVEGSNG